MTVLAPPDTTGNPHAPASAPAVAGSAARRRASGPHPEQPSRSGSGSESLSAFPSLPPTPAAPRPSNTSRSPFPLVEIHVARFGSHAAYARATAFASIGMYSSVPTRLPVTAMHPAFVHTATATAPTATSSTSAGSGTSLDDGPQQQQPTGLLSPSFMPISCHVSPVRPLDALSLATAANATTTIPPGTVNDDDGSHTAPPGGADPGSRSFGARSVDISPPAITSPSASSAAPHVSMVAPLAATAPASGSPTIHILSVSSNNHLLCLLASTGHWNSVEVPLGSIPPGAQALALHASERATAFNFADVVAGKLKSARGSKRGGTKAGGAKSNLVVAVTLEIPPADDNGKPSYALHIYGANTPGSTLERRLFGLAADVQVIPVEYRPLQIQHVEIHLEGFEPNALLVTDQDGPIHIYAEVCTRLRFLQVALDRVFDNFPQINSNVSRVNIHDSDTTRYLGLGYASGELVLIVDHRDPDSGLFDRARQSIHILPLYFTPITAIHFFTAPHLPSTSTSTRQTPGLHLAVAAASEPALVLPNIHTSLPEVPHALELPHSCTYDTVTCITSEPVLWNGKWQLLLGTYGQRILMYDVDPGVNGFELVGIKTMAYPVYNLVWTDLDGDGVRELVVVSMYCLHVLQVWRFFFCFSCM
ncbi:hypothetical protein BCR44DRAFT_117526, partial [Catenaria anguillulae PL171]